MASDEQNTGYVTTVMDLNCLRAIKEQINAGDQGLAPALEQLVSEAEIWYAQGPFSVMEKTKPPPSGDKHDYLSFGPYWWPDPSKKDGLPYIRRDGEVNPESIGDKSDRTSLEKMAIGAETMALAYYFTGKEKFAGRSALYLQTWFLNPETRMNPHLRYGQAIPGTCEGRGIGIIETRRFSQVLNTLMLLEGSPALTEGQKQGMLAWFKSYLEWLTSSANGKAERNEQNNHGTWYDVQVAHMAFYTGDRELTRKVLAEALKNRLGSQVKTDGKQPNELARTRSFTYSLINLSGLLDLTELGSRVGVDYWNYPSTEKSLLKAAVNFVGAYANPSAKWPYQQITPFNRSSVYPFLLEAQFRTSDIRFRELVSLLPKEEAERDRANLLWPMNPCPRGIQFPEPKQVPDSK